MTREPVWALQRPLSRLAADPSAPDVSRDSHRHRLKTERLASGGIDPGFPQRGSPGLGTGGR
jgi:hypothetical protein